MGDRRERRRTGARRAQDTPPEERWLMLESHREQAIAAVRRAVRDRAEAEDCVQEAIVRLAQRGDLDPGRVHSLLTRTALHIAIDRRRSQRRADVAASRLRDLQPHTPASPEDVVAERADLQRAMAAIEALPQRERQVMLMRLSGLSVPETARQLGLSYKSIEGAFTRARARMRLLVGGVLAWIAARRRSSGTPAEGAMVAAAALVFLAGPLWHDITSPGSHPAATLGVAATAAESRPGSANASSTATRASAAHLAQLAPAGAAGGTGDRGGRGHDKPLVTTPPVSIRTPGSGDNQPPLISIGSGYFYSWDGHVDGLAGVQKCLAEGGPYVSTSLIGCPPD